MSKQNIRQKQQKGEREREKNDQERIIKREVEIHGAHPMQHKQTEQMHWNKMRIRKWTIMWEYKQLETLSNESKKKTLVGIAIIIFKYFDVKKKTGRREGKKYSG